MADRYPTPDRRDAPPRPARLSDARGRAALEQAIERTQNRRALERAIEETAHRRGSKGVSRIPRLSPRDAARAAKTLRKAHPVSLALRALAMIQEETRTDTAATSYELVPGHTRGGTCPIVDPLDFADVRTGLPSTTCQTGQAVGPGYGVNCFLGTGIWAKRLFSPNYNQLSWWIPMANCQQIVDAIGPNVRAGVFATGAATKPTAHPSVNPMKATPPGAYELAPVAWTAQAANAFGTDYGSVRTERREVGTEEIESMTGTMTQVIRERDPRDRRPDPRTRERKAVVPQWILSAVGKVTEGLEIHKALYKCLPKELRNQAKRKHYGDQWEALGMARGGFTKKGRGTDSHVEALSKIRKWSLADEHALLWQHADKLDVRCAIFNVLWDMFVEDRAYGEVSKRSKSPFSKAPGGGRSLQVSRQGDANLPHGELPLSVVEEWLKGYLLGKP